MDQVPIASPKGKTPTSPPASPAISSALSPASSSAPTGTPSQTPKICPACGRQEFEGLPVPQTTSNGSGVTTTPDWTSPASTTTTNTTTTTTTTATTPSQAARINSVLEEAPYGDGVEVLVTSLQSQDQPALESALKKLKRFANSLAKKLHVPFNALVMKAVNQAAWVMDGLSMRPMTPLMAAARADNLHALHMLLDIGAEPDLVTDDCGPALMHATSLRCVKTLIAKGANVNAHCPVYGTVLAYAVRHHWPEAALQALLDAGANPDQMAENHSFANHFEHLLLPRLFGDWGRSYQPGGRSNALMMAALNSNTAALQCLINLGVDTELRGGHLDDTALMIAVAARNREAVKILLSAKASIGALAKDGSTALYLACSSGERDIMQLLIDAGARVDQTDQLGLTALQKLERDIECHKSMLWPHQFEEVKELLLKHRAS